MGVPMDGRRGVLVEISIEIEEAVRAILKAREEDIRRAKKSRDLLWYWVMEGPRRAMRKEAPSIDGDMARLPASQQGDVAIIDWMDAGERLCAAIDALVEQIGCRCKGFERGVCPQCHHALEISEAAAGAWRARVEASIGGRSLRALTCG